MGEYDKYFIFKTPPNPVHPESAEEDSDFPQIMTFYINDELNRTLTGAYYMETNIVTKTNTHKQPAKPHNHDFNEYLLFLGTDPKDPFDLGAEVELWIETEKHVFDKTCIVFVPKFVYHCPIIFHRVDRPFVWVTSGDTVRYCGYSYSPDPMWKDYPEMSPEVAAQLPEWMRINK